jgi:hypothetical protein
LKKKLGLDDSSPDTKPLLVQLLESYMSGEKSKGSPMKDHISGSIAKSNHSSNKKEDKRIEPLTFN